MEHEDCLFCKIVNGEIPCYKIYEDNDVLAFLDITNDPAGHTLVIPKKHSDNLLDISEDDYLRLQNVVLKLTKHYLNIGFCQGINTYVNSSKCAGQEVIHYHEHIIPRHENDGIKIEKSSQVSNIDISEICNKIKLK